MEKTQPKKEETIFTSEVSQKEKRKLRAQRKNNTAVWFGLGMMGIIGWSVAVPALLGAALGLWLDRHFPQSFSWTLTFLIIGLFTGSVLAWYWVVKEDKAIHQNNDDNEQ